jgi:phage-related minor tail protein
VEDDMPEPNDASFLRDNERRQRQLETLDRLAQRFGASLSAAFGKNASEGRRLDDVLGRIGNTLLRASLRAAMKPLRTGLEGVFKNAFGTGDAPAATSTVEASSALAKGGVISRGMVMPFAKGGVVAAPTYFPLARGLGLMGERGAEAVMPLARGPDGRLGVSAAGASGRAAQVTVNITTADADSFRRSEAQVAAALARAVARGRRGL